MCCCEVPRQAERVTTALSPGAHRAASVAFAVYLVALACAAFLPLPGLQSIDSGRAVTVNLDLTRPDLLRSWEAERNVLMTVPFGLLLPLVVRWRYEWLVAACLGVTLAIETGQLLGSLAVGWAWRAFDVDDIFLNTVGGLLGLAVTGTVLVLRRRPQRPALHRLVPGALAAGVVTWAVVSTLTVPRTSAVVYACDHPPRAAVTALPGGAAVYAGDDGSLCVRTPDGRSSSLPRDTGPGPVITYDAGGVTFEIGLTVADRSRGTTDDGGHVEAVAVEGAELEVWERPIS